MIKVYNYDGKNEEECRLICLEDLDVYNKIPEVYINGDLLENKNSTNMYYVKNKYDIGSEINITIESDEDDTYDEIDGVYVSYYRDKTYIEDINILKKNMLEVTEVNNGIKGNIKVEEDGILFLSILYDKDLDVYVDGEKVEKIKLLDTFIGVTTTTHVDVLPDNRNGFRTTEALFFFRSAAAVQK